LLPSRDKRFLGQILALTETAGRAVSKGTNQRLIPGDDASVSISVARQALGDKLGIAEIVLSRYKSHYNVDESVWKKAREVTKEKEFVDRIEAIRAQSNGPPILFTNSISALESPLPARA
jgi:hypothetical protein